MRKPLLFISASLIFSLSFAQKEKNKRKSPGEETPDLVNQIGDSTRFLNRFASQACSCIDSVNMAESEKQKKMDAFSNCIDEQVGPYQLAVSLLGSLKSSGQNTTISISYDKNSSTYRSHYFTIERWLMDSCATLKRVIATNDIEKEKSFSKDPEAMKVYNAGVALLQKEKYADGIPYFEKAVNIDPAFAFAWDNLGICYRRTNDLAKAEAAYKSSLKIDPTGKTPLQNLAVVYQLQEKGDEAIATYKEIVKYYPDDPETYYGIGTVYYNNKKDMESALDNMCKAYNIYTAQRSPYRSDAEKMINMIYSQMKKEGKAEKFYQILKDNNIKSN